MKPSDMFSELSPQNSFYWTRSDSVTGFRETDLYPPLQFDRTHIECFQDTPIHVIAQAAGTHFKVIKDLNPEIRGHFLAAGMHSLLIPQRCGEWISCPIQTVGSKMAAENQERVYVVKEGDNLTTIAERFNVPLPALLIWNRLDGGKKRFIRVIGWLFIPTKLEVVSIRRLMPNSDKLNFVLSGVVVLFCDFPGPGVDDKK